MEIKATNQIHWYSSSEYIEQIVESQYGNMPSDKLIQELVKNEAKGNIIDIVG